MIVWLRVLTAVTKEIMTRYKVDGIFSNRWAVRGVEPFPKGGPGAEYAGLR
jgi:hypothetical protein